MLSQSAVAIASIAFNGIVAIPFAWAVITEIRTGFSASMAFTRQMRIGTLIGSLLGLLSVNTLSLLKTFNIFSDSTLITPWVIVLNFT